MKPNRTYTEYSVHALLEEERQEQALRAHYTRERSKPIRFVGLKAFILFLLAAGVLGYWLSGWRF